MQSLQQEKDKLKDDLDTTWQLQQQELEMQQLQHFQVCCENVKNMKIYHDMSNFAQLGHGARYTGSLYLPSYRFYVL